MKVHLWAPEFSGFGGGIGVFSRELARSLVHLGHDVRLFGKLDPNGNWDGFRLNGTSAVPAAFRSPAFAAMTLNAVARDRPDLIITTHVNFGAITRLAGKLFKSRTCIIAHGIDVHPGLSSARSNAIKYADKVVAVSRWTRARIADVCSISESRILILPNTVDENRFTVRAAPAELRIRLGIKAGEKVVVTVARLDPSEIHDTKRGNDAPTIKEGSAYKGCDRLIESLPEVLRRCGPVKYVVVGKGADQARLQALASRHGVSEWVTFSGFVPDEELPDYYRLADVFAMPSVGEGFGIVFLEAMACGTPVLAGNRDGSVDAVADGQLGLLVNPDSVSEIANGLSELLQKKGPSLWFDRERLHDAIAERFGHNAFRRRVAEILAS